MDGDRVPLAFVCFFFPLYSQQGLLDDVSMTDENGNIIPVILVPYVFWLFWFLLLTSLLLLLLRSY